MKLILSFFIVPFLAASAELHSVPDMDVSLVYQVSRHATNDGSGGNYFQTFNAVSEVDAGDSYTISLISWTDELNAQSSFNYLSGPSTNLSTQIVTLSDGVFPAFQNNADWSAWQTNIVFSAWDWPNYKADHILATPFGLAPAQDLWVDWNSDGSARVTAGSAPSDFGKYLSDGSINPNYVAPLAVKKHRGRK